MEFFNEERVFAWKGECGGDKIFKKLKKRKKQS
jgi:hypothetical protein